MTIQAQPPQVNSTAGQVRGFSPFVLGVMLLVAGCRLGYDTTAASNPPLESAGAGTSAGAPATDLGRGGSFSSASATLGAAGSSGSVASAAGGATQNPTASTGIGGSAGGLNRSGGAAASCSDGVLNQDESAVDCGGNSCAPCPCRYSTPTLLANPNYVGNRLWSPTISADGLAIYFGAEIVGTAEQLAFSTRTDTNATFGLGQLVPAPVGQGTEGTPFVLPEGLALYFYSARAGSRDLYVSRRASTSEQFATLQAIAEVNTDGMEHLPWVSADELTLYFTRTPKDQSNADIWRATRASIAAPFASPQPVAELNSSLAEDRAALTTDQRRVLFGSQRAGDAMRLYEAVRATTVEPFGTPYLITDLAGDGADYNPALTVDGTGLYFTSTRSGSNYQLWYSARSCP